MTRFLRRTCALSAAAVAFSATTVLAVPASADPVEHCVATVVDETADGELILSDPECFGEFPVAMADAGLGSSIDTASEASAAVASASFTIGIHFDGANYTGSSFSVVGTDCGGGYLNMSAAWDNRVSSTIGGCPRIRHWTGANKTGSYQDTLPSGNLSSPVNNAVSSIQYLT